MSTREHDVEALQVQVELFISIPIEEADAYNLILREVQLVGYIGVTNLVTEKQNVAAFFHLAVLA